MRFHQVLILLFVFFAGCATREGKLKDQPLEFVTTAVQSPSLLVKPDLRWLPASKRMELNIRMDNLDASTITIKEITFNNPTGLNSSVEITSLQNPSLAPGKHTLLTATIAHVHDKKLFYETGLTGLIDSTYAISVLYKIEGKEDLRVVNLLSKLPREKYLAYLDRNATSIHTYLLSDGNSFVERQKEFLIANNVSSGSTFVHVTDQEIALAGLNFKIKCFYKTDTLYTELFAVNHSEMELQIDTSKLDVLVDGHLLNDTDGTLTLEKITGQKQSPTVLAKGDRINVLIRYKVDQAPKNISIAVANSFLIRNGTRLFHDDLSLLRAAELKTTEL